MTNIAIASLSHRRLNKGVFIATAHDNKNIECINAHCWIIEPQLRKVLLQKRSYNDGCFGGFYDISLAGHVDEGETPYEAMIREAKEEGGINIAKYICHKPKKIYFSERGWYNNIPFTHNQQAFVFMASLRMDKIKKIQSADKNEVAEFKLIDFNLFKQWALSKNRRLVPHPQLYYREVIKMMSAIFDVSEKTVSIKL